MLHFLSLDMPELRTSLYHWRMVCLIHCLSIVFANKVQKRAKNSDSFKRGKNMYTPEFFQSLSYNQLYSLRNTWRLWCSIMLSQHCKCGYIKVQTIEIQFLKNRSFIFDQLLLCLCCCHLHFLMSLSFVISTEITPRNAA